MNNKTLTAKRTAGISGKPVITIDHICGDDAEFSIDELMDLAETLQQIAVDAMNYSLRTGETREYLIGE